MKKKFIKYTIFSCSIAVFLILSNHLSKAYILQQKQNENKNLYEKIESEQPLSYLVIGDSIGRGSGASEKKNKWFYILERDMLKHQNVKMDGDNLVQSGATAFEGLFRLQTQKSRYPKNYDLVFIVFGENDRKYMKAHDFSVIYESLIRNVKMMYPNAEIFTITESPLKNKEFINTIEKISYHYNATNVNMIEAYRRSEKSSAALTTDNVHPNDEGYQIYANEIFNKLRVNTSVGKKIAELTAPIHENSNITFDVFGDYTTQEGFVRQSDYFISSTKGSYIEFSFYGSLLGIKLFRTPDGGNVNVYIDDKFHTKISTWWPFQRERYLYISSGLDDGLHTVRFEVTGDSSSNNVSNQSVVRLSSIIMSKKMEDTPVNK